MMMDLQRLVLLLAAILVLAGCAHGFDRGMAALEGQDFEQAEEIARNELRSDSNSPWANLLMAETLYARGEYRRAAGFARRAVESEAYPVRAPRLLGDIYSAMNQPVDAADAYYQARQADAESVDDETFKEVLLRAITYANVRRDHEHEWRLRSWLREVAPDHPEAGGEQIAISRRAFAAALRQQGELVAAAELLEQALRDDPSYLSREALDLGEIYARLNMGEDAAEAWLLYLEAETSAEERTQRHRDVAELAGRHQMYDLAIVALSNLRALLDDAEAAPILLQIAGYQFLAGESSDAHRRLNEYLEVAAQDREMGNYSSEPYRAAVHIALEANQTRIAITILERAVVEAEPSRPLTQQLADIYARRAQLDRVEEVLNRYAERQEETYSALFFAGNWAHQRNNFELARHFYQRATERPGAEAGLWLTLAEVLVELDEDDAMNQAIQAYLRAQNHNDFALQQAAELYVQHRHFEQAERLLRQLRQRHRDSFDHALQLARLYQRWARPSEAAAVWDDWLNRRGNQASDIDRVAQILFNQGDLERAARFYRRAAEAGHHQSWLRAADIYMQQDHQAALAQALDAYLQASAGSAQALSDVALRYQRAGMDARQIEVLHELIKLQPNNWRSHETLSNLLLEQGRSTEAFAVLTHFVENAPNTFEALEMIGGRLTSRHPASWLIDFYRPWTEGERTNPQIWRLMGDAYYSLSYEDALSEGTSEEALRQARNLYMRFLDESKSQRLDWRALALEWNQKQMWGPASLAFERFIEEGGAPQLYSMAYSETLLRLGRPTEAERILADHFRTQNRRPDVALRIARLLQNFQRFDSASEYARHVFVSGNDDATLEGFSILAEIYRQQEDFDSLEALVAELPQRTSNRTRARRLLISVLENHGRWEQTLEQLDRFQDSVVDLAAFQQGRTFYKLDRPDDAFEAFERAARQSGTPAQTWLEAAAFFSNRGENERAQRAFEAALQIAPDSMDIRARYGPSLIERGLIAQAMAEYEFGLRAGEAFTVRHRVAFFEALVKAGYYEHARAVAEQMDLSSGRTPSEIANRVGAWGLRSQDAPTLNTAIARLHARTWGVSAVLNYLEEAGHHDENLRLIREEFEEGDPTTASILLITHAPAMVRLSDWSLHGNYLQAIVDPFTRSDTRLIGAVGDHRTRRGQLEEARTYLQAAVDHDDELYRPQLGQTLLFLGKREEAMAQFETWLVEHGAEPRALESVLLRFELAGDADGAALFLERISEEPALLHIALPQQIHHDLERHGDPQRAVDSLLETLQQAATLPAPLFRGQNRRRRSASAALSQDEIISAALIHSLESVAALGHLSTVKETLARDDLPETRPGQLNLLSLKLALAEGDLNEASRFAEAIVEASDGARERQQARLNLARRFIGFGADAPARKLIDDALEEQSDFRSHEPFVLHLGLLLITGEREDLSPEIDAYLKRVPNRFDARMVLIDELRRLGRDKEALQLARHASRFSPTAEVLRQGLLAALNEGDAAAARDFADQFIAVAETPFSDLEELIFGRLPGSEPELMLPIVERVRAARPADLRWTTQHIRLLFVQGDVQKARRLITETLESRAHHREVVTDLVDVLYEERLDVEIARVVAPLVPAEALWPRLLIRFAEAEFALGDVERAEAWLARLDETARNPELWRMELADSLVSRQLFHFLEPVLATLPADALSPHARYLRGVARIADGQSEEGLEDLRIANHGGVRLFLSHYYAIRAALSADDLETTLVLMQELNELPIHHNDAVSFPLQLLLRAAMDQPGGATAIRTYLEEERPRLIDGHGATWTQFTGQLASAFEYTGDPEGAYGFYRDRIWQSLFQRDVDRTLPIYLNNLAYTYSTTNRHIDRGLDKIYRAIVLDSRRNASFIDTLGWLLYREGDLLAAEAEIRRALRTFEGPPSGLRELYRHLYIILDERGIYDQAAWLAAHLSRLPVSDMTW